MADDHASLAAHRPARHAAVSSSQFLVEGLTGLRRTSAFRKSPDLDDAHIAIERDSDHVAGSHQAAWCVDAGAVDSHVTGAGECCRGAARAHQPGMPQPPVDALALRSSATTLATAFGLGFELRFQGGEFGERRIRIRRLLAPLVPFVSRRRTSRPFLFAPRPIEPLIAAALPAALVARVAAGLVSLRLPRLRLRSLIGSGRGRFGSAVGCGGRHARQRLRAVRSGAVACGSMLARLALAKPRAFAAPLGAAGPPHLDQFGLGGYGRLRRRARLSASAASEADAGGGATDSSSLETTSLAATSLGATSLAAASTTGSVSGLRSS